MRIQMESDKRQAEERERHREDDRRRDDQRFQMQMMMMMNLMNPNRQHHHSPFVPLNHTPKTVNSMETSREEKCEFCADRQVGISREGLIILLLLLAG